MSETGCLKDGHFQNLEVASNLLVTGSTDAQVLSINSTRAVFGPSITASLDFPVAMRPFSTNLVRNFGPDPLAVDPGETDNFLKNTATPDGVFPVIVDYLKSLITGGSTTPILSSANTAIIGGDASRIGAATTSLSGDGVKVAPTGALVADGQVTLLNGDTTVGAATATPVDDLTDDVCALIIFGADNTLTDKQTFTLPFNATDGVTADSFEVVDHDLVTGSTTKRPAVSYADTITLLASGTTTIRKGSFIFLKWLDANTIAVKACISTSQGAITTSCA